MTRLGALLPSGINRFVARIDKKNSFFKGNTHFTPFLQTQNSNCAHSVLLMEDDIRPDSMSLAGVQFGLLSARQVRNSSAVEVCETNLHYRKQPRSGGPIDTRLGTSSRFYTCGTCRNPIESCLLYMDITIDFKNSVAKLNFEIFEFGLVKKVQIPDIQLPRVLFFNFSSDMK